MKESLVFSARISPYRVEKILPYCMTAITMRDIFISAYVVFYKNIVVCVKITSFFTSFCINFLLRELIMETGNVENRQQPDIRAKTA